jgi:hypothetical protein
MFRMSATFSILTTLFSSALLTSDTATTWQDAVVVAMAETDPPGDWQLVPAERPPAPAGAQPEVLIERRSDGSTSASYHGSTMLEPRTIAAMSLDGTQALVQPRDILVCDSELGCGTILPDEGAFRGVDLGECDDLSCGSGVDLLTDASPVYLVVDILVDPNGREVHEVSGIIVGFEIAFHGIEPDEID